MNVPGASVLGGSATRSRMQELPRLVPVSPRQGAHHRGAGDASAPAPEPPLPLAAATDAADERAEAEAAVELRRRRSCAAPREEAEAQAAGERRRAVLGRREGAGGWTSSGRWCRARRRRGRAAARALAPPSLGPRGHGRRRDAEEVRLFEKGWTDCRDAASCVMRDAGNVHRAREDESRGLETTVPKDVQRRVDVAVARPGPPVQRLELLSWSPLFVPGGGAGPAPPPAACTPSF